MRLILPVLVLCVFVVSCGSNVVGPNGVPDPQQVPHDAIPQPFGETFYFKYGWDQQDGPGAILDMLLHQDVQMRAAWVPDPDHPGPCRMFVQLTQLIIQLGRPDPRMLELGFTQNATSVHLGVCNPFWLEYDFGR